MKPSSIHADAETWAATAATGGLDSEESAAWNQHLATCASCKQLNEEHMAMAKMLKHTLDAAAPDSGFEQRIIGRLHEAAIRGAAPGHWYDFLLMRPGFVAATACAAVAAIASISWMSFHGDHATPHPSIAASEAGLPEMVRAGIETQARGTSISSVTRNNEDGEVTYTIATKSANEPESQFTVAEDGSLLSVDKNLADIPSSVRTAINTTAGTLRVSAVEEDFDGNAASYVATIIGANGGERDFRFDSDGTLMDIETSLAELPASLQEAIKAKVGQGQLEGVEKSLDNGESTYVATISSNAGKARDYTFAADGSLLGMEVLPEELPAGLQAAIKTEVGTGRLGSIDETYDDGEVTYDARMTSANGRELDFSLSEQGQLISREVAMDDAPAAVRQTISQKLGGSKVIEIDQSFSDAINQSVPYEIEAWKDGKPFYFLVSPTGDYLGMED